MKKESKEKSKCCSAPIRVSSGAGDFHDSERGITMCWVCESCGKPCDIDEEDERNKRLTDRLGTK